MAPDHFIYINNEPINFFYKISYRISYTNNKSLFINVILQKKLFLFSSSNWQSKIWSNGETNVGNRSLFVERPNILKFNAKNASLTLRVFEEIQSKINQTTVLEKNILVLDNNPGQLYRFNRSLSEVEIFKFYPTYRTLEYGKLIELSFNMNSYM